MTRPLPADRASGPVRVLLCDDVEAFRGLMRHLLAEELRIEVVGEAGDGLTGLEAAERLRPDVVLLDLSMPQADGLEILPLIRERLPTTAVVALSGFGAERMERSVLDLGAWAYVEKGADIQVIREAVLAAADRRPIAA